LVAGSVLLGATGAQAALSGPFEQLRSYDGQARAASVAIYSQIRAAKGNKAQMAAIEQGLLGVIQDPAATYAAKQEAGRLLWMAGTARSVPVLAKMLLDAKQGDVARYALERNTDPSVGKALVAALAKAKGAALIGIVNTLGDRREAPAVPALKTLAASKDAQVSAAAVAALGKVGTVSALTALQALPAKTAAPAVLLCAERLAAAGQKAPAEAAFKKMLAQGPTPESRGSGLKGLVAMKSPLAGPLAIQTLKAKDAYLQTVAAKLAGSLADPTTTSAAVKAWPGLPVFAQTVLLTSLADRHAPAAAPLALKAMASTDPTLRTAGIRSAGLVGGAGAVAALAQMSATGEGQDRETARDVLSTMPGKSTDQSILQAAKQSTPQVRAGLMAVLAERATPASKAVLLESARGTDSRMASEALRSLAKIGTVQDRASLLGLMVETRDDSVRDAAKGAVLAITRRAGDGTAQAPTLVAALSNASTGAKAALLSVLAEVGGDDALKALTQGTQDSDPEVQSAAVSALAEAWPDTLAQPVLLDIAKNSQNKSLRVRALQGYLRLVDQDDNASPEAKVEELSQAITLAERPEEKRQALGALRECRVPAAVSLAAQQLPDPDLASEASDTIIDLAGPRRRNGRNLPAVKGADTNAALDKVVQVAKDDNQKADAQRLKS
jgi:HEAT repeat protein